jgi:alpha-glucosidase
MRLQSQSTTATQIGQRAFVPRLTAIMTVCLVMLGGMDSFGLQLNSPDGRIGLRFELTNVLDETAVPVYSIRRNGQTVLSPSRLGLTFRSLPILAGFTITHQATTNADTTWHPVYGERSTIRDHYNELRLTLEAQDAAGFQLELTFRAYNEGVAFCYTIPRQPGLHRVTIERELTEFSFPADYRAWVTYTAQGEYTNTSVSGIRPGCERPLVLQAATNLYLAVAEARLVDHARMKLAPATNRPHTLVAQLDGEVIAPLPWRTPWRVIMIAERPGQLLENNDLILNLNDPCALPNTAWIKPGKILRDRSLTTAGAKACVDFAVQRNLQYVHFDAGWYGREDSETSDARAVNLDPARSPGPFDLPEIIAYAKERNIGTLLYVNRRALERQLDELLPLYRSWGVQGIKFGFVRVGPQQWTRWLHDSIRKAADYEMMVDVHDEYRPTGWSRTYPNLMTQEGVRGDEELQPNRMALTTLFTRFIAGAADNTICYYDERVSRNSSHAFQLAKAVCFYSPWQFLYWYDRPPTVTTTNSPPAPDYNIIGNEPELEFFDHCPTVWDDTKVLQGEIGEYAVIARRRSTDWFIGGMNANRPRELKVPLSFLAPDTNYLAHIYADDPAVPTRTRVRIDRIEVSHTSVITMQLSEQGGQAVRIVALPIRSLRGKTAILPRSK